MDDPSLPHSPRSGGLVDSIPRNADYRRSYSAPVQPEEMDERSSELPPTAGALRPPGELGVTPTTVTSSASNEEAYPEVHPRTVAQHRRLRHAVNRGNAMMERVRDLAESPSVVTTSFCYNGMEIVMACSPEHTLFVICARTFMVLQTLPCPHVLTALHSHPATGQVAAVSEAGEVQLYRPIPADPRLIAMGRYRWEIMGSLVPCCEAFHDIAIGMPFSVSLSQADKFLVAHRDQLAVYSTETAELLWTTRLPASVVAAAIAGDGCGLAVVLDEDPTDSAAASGVHTFHHDELDGSQQDIGVIATSSSRSIGMVFKPGPFLVHPSTVTSVAFRGYGHCTSSVSQGNDLLLTQCEGSAQIFSQNNWSPLTEWKMPPNTQVFWVEGITAFTLGDLETYKKKPINPSEPEGIHETLGKRLHFSTIARHTTTPTTTNAGAWVMEVTTRTDDINATAVRLSRLAYLKRGVDDLKPTLLECVSQYVPGILRNPTVAGVWPAWSQSSAATATQNPPMELRFVSPLCHGRVSVLELSVLEDEARTTAELGYPVQRVLALDQLDHCAISHVTEPSKLSRKRVRKNVVKTSAWYGSSRLVAEMSHNQSAISIIWRQPGTCSMLPRDWQPDDVEPARAIHRFAKNPDSLTDESHIPVPLALPAIGVSEEGGSIYQLLWWQDDALHGAPLLVALLRDGTVVVLEVPPPTSFLEPAMPDLGDPPSKTMTVEMRETVPEHQPVSDEYEISIIPDPEYGLGIRLESHADGFCALAGTFKRHPVNGDLLPAEKSGLMRLGDELLAANDVSLEKKPFDDIVGVVREMGASSGPGNPMRLKFRAASRAERRGKRTSESSKPKHRTRRTMEEMIGVASEAIGGNKTIRHTDGLPRKGSYDPPLPTRDAALNHQVATFSSALPTTDDEVSDMCCDLLPFDDGINNQNKVALLFWAMEKALGVSMITITYSDDGSIDQKNYDEVARTNDLGDSSGGRIQCLEVVQSDENHFTIASCSQMGIIHITSLSINRLEIADPLAHEFQTSPSAQLLHRWSSDCVFRLYSPTLFATLQPIDNTNDEVIVWSALTEPGASAHESNGTPVFAQRYYPTTVNIAKRSDDFEIIDFSFLQAGYLDSNPLLVTTSMRSISLFSKQAGSPSWKKALEIFFGSPSWSAQPSLRSYVEMIEEPLNVFPHLIAACCASYTSSDEETSIRSSWHPESLIAGLFTNNQGVKCAISTLRNFFLWFASDGCEIPVGHRFSNLLVAPMKITDPSEESDGEAIQQRAQYSSLFSKAAKGADSATIQSVKPMLMKCIDELTARKNSTRNLVEDDGPALLKTLEIDDLKILWALADIAENMAAFEQFDHPASVFLLAFSLFSSLKSISKEDGNGVDTATMAAHSMMTRTPSNLRKKDCPKVSPSLASSCALAALLSSDQSLLVENISKGRKLTWKNARECRIALWRRSDSELADLTGKIGQNVFLESRDSMEAALFFILAGRLSTFRNYVATDHTLTGKTFSQFLAKHDFTTERGRRAAEKNAFSLLRKCKYQAAAAFFLLAEPPFLKSAVETIATKMLDIDLAFLVARLMESPTRSAWSVRSGGSMGGGGGYASSFLGASSGGTGSKEPFINWKPRLGIITENLLVDRMLPACDEDDHIAAICLLWLGKNEEASWIISGGLEMNILGDTKFTNTYDVPSRFQKKLLASKQYRSPHNSILKSNLFIDLAFTPIVLKLLNASTRVRLAASIAVCDTLTCRGVELPAIKALQEANRQGDFLNDKQTGQIEKLSQNDARSSATTRENGMNSSVFDSFAPCPPAKSISSEVSSSIFDSYETPPPRPPQPSIAPSIFDDFDIPSKVVSQPKTPTAPAQAQSSIFDDFDVPRQMNSDSPSASQVSTKTPASTKTSGLADKQSNSANRVKRSQIPILIEISPSPAIWNEWVASKQTVCLARRLIREIASIVSRFYGDPCAVPVERFYAQSDSLLSPYVAEVLQLPCETNSIMATLESVVNELCSLGKLSSKSLVQVAISLLGPSDSRRILFSVLLNHAIGRPDIADGVVQKSANELVRWCSTFASSFDDLVEKRQTRSYCSSHFIRREAARLSWQLEACLWLHRGGKLTLPRQTQQEATVAVRIGLLLASWNRDFFCLESLVSCSPDCMIDEDAGLQLWRSMKLTKQSRSNALNQKANSGGWEFLVNCKRSQATDLLREKNTGCFIIRPHSESNGVFTLSFKTNLIPASSRDEDDEPEGQSAHDTSGDELGYADESENNENSRSKKVRKEDVVQHAIIRLSDSGFRCGSFGPYTSLISLLEAVSESLPFKLRFDLPPKSRVIPEEGSQISPNAVLLRKLTLRNANSLITNAPGGDIIPEAHDRRDPVELSSREHLSFGQMLQLAVLCGLRRQLSGVSAAIVDHSVALTEDVRFIEDPEKTLDASLKAALRTLRPFASWCRSAEIATARQLSPVITPEKVDAKLMRYNILDTSQNGAVPSDEFEITPHASKGMAGDTGDSILRGMVQPDSGVEFSTLRLIDGGECSILVLVSKMEAIRWIVQKKFESTEEEAIERLEKMESCRVIEAIDVSKLPIKLKPIDHQHDEVRYRIVDPWEVEAVKNREGETRGVSIGRCTYAGFSSGRVALATEHNFRELGGVTLLELWANMKGGATFTEALSMIQPPWERADSGDLQMNNGNVTEPALFFNSIRRHLYRNALFRQLKLPQRFLALVQVEMLDLKNLTSPGGLLSLTAYALLRLRRSGSGGPLTNKARTIDSAATQPVKLNKTSGPHAPASWGSVVRFRFPLPEQVQPNGQSAVRDQEALFKGPPCFLQVSVYEKKLLVDHALGTADISMDGLGAGGQLEEWVPLRTENRGITWFARIRLTLRFELMCLDPTSKEVPGVGLERIQELSRLGGAAQEDVQHRSTSSPDLLRYLEGFVY